MATAGETGAMCHRRAGCRGAGRAALAVAAALASFAAFALPSYPSSSSRQVEPVELMKQNPEFPGLSITGATLPGRCARHSPDEISLVFANELKTPRTLDVTVGGQTSRVHRRVTVAAESSLRADFTVPYVGVDQESAFNRERRPSRGGRFDVRVEENGREAELFTKDIRVAKFVEIRTSSDLSMAVLSGSAADTKAAVGEYKAREGAYAEVLKKKGVPMQEYESQADWFYGFSFDEIDFDSPAWTWSADWRAYAGYDGVLLTDGEWKALAPGARRALADYVAVGGALLLAGGEGVPKEISPMAALGLGAPGYGEFARLPATAAGGRIRADRDDMERRMRGARARLLATFGNFLDGRKSLGAMKGFSIPDFPARAVAAVFAVFAVVVALFTLWCVRKARRILLLMFVPAASMVASVAVFASVLATYGVVPTLRRQSIVSLDQPSRRAVVRTLGLLLSPGDRSGDLRFSRTADVQMSDGGGRSYGFLGIMPVPAFECGERLSGVDRILKPWVPTGFIVTDVEDTPRRLEVVPSAPGRMRVRNLLGAAVKKLVVRDAEGGEYRATDLGEAETRELALSAGERAASGGPATEAIDLFKFGELEDAAFSGAGGCRPPCAHYWAYLESSPFGVDPLEGSAAARSDATIVFGYLGE